jgi:hypothetical protein
MNSPPPPSPPPPSPPSPPPPLVHSHPAPEGRSLHAVLAATAFLVGTSLFLIVVMRPALPVPWTACVVVTCWTVSLGAYLWAVTQPRAPNSGPVEVSSDEAFAKYADRYIENRYGPHWRGMSAVIAVITTAAAVVFGFQLFDAPKRIEDIRRSTAALSDGVRESLELIPDTVDRLTTKTQDLQMALRAESLRTGSTDFRMNERPRILRTVAELGFYRTAIMDRQIKVLRRYVKDPNGKYQPLRRDLEALTRDLIDPKKICDNRDNDVAPVEADMIAMDAGLEPEDAGPTQLACLAQRLEHAAKSFESKDYTGAEDYPDGVVPEHIQSYRYFLSGKLHRAAAQIGTRIALLCSKDNQPPCALLEKVRSAAERLPLLVPNKPRPEYAEAKVRNQSNAIAMGDTLCLTELGLSEAHFDALGTDGKIFEAYNDHLLGWWKWRTGDFDEARKWLLRAQKRAEESKSTNSRYATDFDQKPLVFAAALNTLAWSYLEGDEKGARTAVNQPYDALLYAKAAVEETGATVNDKRFDRLETYVRALQRVGMVYPATMQLYGGFIELGGYGARRNQLEWMDKYCHRFLEADEGHAALLDQADEHYREYMTAASHPDGMIQFKVGRLLQVRASVTWLCEQNTDALKHASRKPETTVPRLTWSGGQGDVLEEDLYPDAALKAAALFCDAQSYLRAAAQTPAVRALALVAIDYGNGWLSACGSELRKSHADSCLCPSQPKVVEERQGGREEFLLSSPIDRRSALLGAHFPVADVDARVVMNGIAAELEGEPDELSAFELADMAMDVFASTPMDARQTLALADAAIRARPFSGLQRLGTAFAAGLSCGKPSPAFAELVKRNQGFMKGILSSRIDCERRL